MSRASSWPITVMVFNGDPSLCAAAVAKEPSARTCCSSAMANLASVNAVDKRRAFDATHHVYPPRKQLDKINAIQTPAR